MSAAQRALSEAAVRRWVRYFLDPKLTPSQADKLLKRMPSDTDLARWINETMGWSYGR